MLIRPGSAQSSCVAVVVAGLLARCLLLGHVPQGQVGDLVCRDMLVVKGANVPCNQRNSIAVWQASQVPADAAAGLGILHMLCRLVAAMAQPPTAVQRPGLLCRRHPAVNTQRLLCVDQLHSSCQSGCKHIANPLMKGAACHASLSSTWLLLCVWSCVSACLPCSCHLDLHRPCGSWLQQWRRICQACQTRMHQALPQEQQTSLPPGLHVAHQHRGSAKHTHCVGPPPAASTWMQELATSVVQAAAAALVANGACAIWPRCGRAWCLRPTSWS